MYHAGDEATAANHTESSTVRRGLLLASPLAILLTFLVLGGYQLSLPGLHYDEAREAGLNAMELLTRQPVTAFRDATIQVGPWRLPLMVQDYIGALNALLAIPFLAVGGINVVALRWLPLLVGALTLLCTWRIAWRIGGPASAAGAGILLAVNPSFVFWSRQGIFVTNITALLFVASLLTGLRWWQSGRARATDLWLTALLWGLGIYAKLLFVWAIVAMLVVAAASWLLERWAAHREARRGQGHAARASASRLPPPSSPGNASNTLSIRGAEVLQPKISVPVTWAVVAACFLLPLVPLIIFNIRTGGTLTSIFGNLSHSYYGVNNRAYLPNLLVRLDQLRTLLRGDHFWYLGGVFANRWAPWIAAGLVLTAAGWSATSWIGRNRSANGPICSSMPFLPLALLGLMVAQSAFTVSDLFITHYAILLPLLPLSAGLMAGLLVRSPNQPPSVPQLGPPRSARHFVPLLIGLWGVIAVCAWAGGDIWTTLRYHQALAVTGGHATHSDAIDELAQYLDRSGFTAPLALDWGMDAPVRFLTAGRVHPVEVFGYAGLDTPDSGFAARVEPFIPNVANVYLAHTPEDTVFRGRLAALIALAQKNGFSVREEKRISERSGRPIFMVYRIVR